MKKILFVLAALLAPAPARAGGLADLGGLLPPHYFHMGFNQVAGGLFAPIAGGGDQAQQAGLITPVVEHDAGPGGLCFGTFCPGIGWNPLNLGYIGSTASARDVLHGKLALGPSVQTGELVKKLARAACRGRLPAWGDAGSYRLLKAVFAPGQQGVYADVGVYAALPLNGLGDPTHLKGEGLLGFTLVKTFGPAPAAVAP